MNNVIDKTFLYRYFNSKRELLYVGVSINAVNRLQQHKRNSDWFDEITDVNIKPFKDRSSALEAENIAISEENPKYNLHRPTIGEISKHIRESKQHYEKQILTVKPVYKVDECAKALQIPKTKINKLIEKGILKAWKISNKQNNTSYRVSGWQLLEFMEALNTGQVVLTDVEL